MTENRIRTAAMLLVFALIFGLMTTTASAYSGIALDVEDNPVYQCITAYTLIDGYQRNIKALEKEYDGRFLAVYGTLTGKSLDYKTFYIRDNNNHSVTSIECRSSKEMRELAGIAVGKTVRVMGKLSVSTFFTKSVSLKADKVEETDTATVSSTVYVTGKGSVMNSLSMQKRSIEGGFDFYIPGSWRKVESELPNVPGYQYKLNELTGRGIAESVFIFYVDETFLKKPTDITSTGRVRKAIVENILCNSHLKMYSSYLPLFDRDIDISSSSTDYAKFEYYTGAYKERNINAYNHRVEFAFIEDGRKDGVCAILYVYNDPEHADEVLFMMRMLGEK